MLLVRTRLGVSDIEGIGLFADEFIPAGTVIWEMNDVIDLSLTSGEIERLSDISRSQVRKYSYLDKQSGRYVFCGDDARFFNHSDTPNCIDVADGPHGGRTLAITDIHPGQELTCDYSLFDAEFAREMANYSTNGHAVHGSIHSNNGSFV
jgi:SET domain-containing protein